LQDESVREETVNGAVASLSGALRSRLIHPAAPGPTTMNAFIVYIFLCAASTAPGDCDRSSAIDVMLGPEARNEVMCGLEAQETVALTAVRPGDGEYVKISCLRRRPPTSD
jgi:hypothetical protein